VTDRLQSYQHIGTASTQI